MIAVIPARFGSEGVKDKNWRDFCGTSLVQLAIDFARESEMEPLVTTNKPFKIPCNSMSVTSEIHDSEALAINVWRDALEQYDDKPTEYTCYLEPSSPFRTKEDLIRCELALELGWYKIAATLSPAGPPQKLLTMGIQDGHKIPLGDLTNKPRQGMGKHYRRNGAIYMARTEHILSGCMMEDRCCPVISFGPRINIDTEDDFLLAELLWRYQHPKPITI